MLRQGFPIKMLERHQLSEFPESNVQDLAGNMVSTTIMLAAVCATMAAVSWIPDEENKEGPDNAAKELGPDNAEEVQAEEQVARTPLPLRKGGLLRRVISAPSSATDTSNVSRFV